VDQTLNQNHYEHQNQGDLHFQKLNYKCLRKENDNSKEASRERLKLEINFQIFSCNLPQLKKQKFESLF